MTSLLRLFMLFGLFLFILNVSTTQAGEVSPEKRLRKLSLHLRGIPPKPEEYDELQVARADLTTFFENKTKSYLNSPSYAAKMQTRFAEIFRFRPQSMPIENEVADLQNYIFSEEKLKANEFNYSIYDSAALLFLSLPLKNLSIDQLALSREYIIGNKAQPTDKIENVFDAGFYSSDRDFFRAPLVRNQWSVFSQKKPFVFEFTLRADDADKNTMGAVTTLSFFRRYVDTSTNLARRRAAAIFNIFLCDEMRPVSIPSEEENQKLLRESLGTLSSGASEHAVAMRSEQRHGTDPACMSCHAKLDPLASAFRGMGDKYSSAPGRGALIYKIAEHSVNTPFYGLSGLAQVIVQQPEYLSCQTHRFWNWFIGEDVKLSPAREQELIKAIEENGRRTNDIVATLVRAPEFYNSKETESPAQLSARKAAKVLSDCSNCHRDSGVSILLNSWPIGGSLSTHRAWITKIEEAVDLKGNGAHAAMPPTYAGWDKSYIEQSRKDLKEWICLGAPDETGRTSIDIPEDLCAH